jgi:heat-inducible transcriptional repressor
MADAIQMASAALMPDQADHNEFVMAGQTNLMDIADLSDVDKLRELFDGFTRQRDILHLLDKSLAAGGVQIFIGQESGYHMLNECSLVAAPYEVDHEVVGVLGVIGPTRMAYERIIPIVDVTAKMLGMALNSRF